MKWQLSSKEIVSATGARYSGAEMSVNGVGTDSRVEGVGRLFVALKGERFDGHDYVAAAVSNGASAVLVHQDRPEFEKLKQKVAFFHVSDTLEALQRLGSFWRRKHDFFVLAISGSNGKTSSKEMTFEILKGFQPTVASQGSFNNHWGVPISILSAAPDTRILVLEMGMNHLGELAALATLADPNVTVITMVGSSHIGLLGSQENIAKAKEELYLGAPKSIAIFNLDNQWTSSMYVRAMSRGTHKRLLTFSSHKPNCDVCLRAERMTMDGLEVVGTIAGVSGRVFVRIFGRQNLNNLMVASSLALSAGMPPADIWKRLPDLSVETWGRNQWMTMPSKASVLFDAYNANPSSMAAMLRNVYELESQGQKILILGDMLELGEESARAHQELGDLAGKVGVDMIWFIGSHAGDVEQALSKSGFAGQSFFSRDFDSQISSTIKETLKANDVVAIKASRGQRLERVLEHWGIKT